METLIVFLMLVVIVAGFVLETALHLIALAVSFLCQLILEGLTKVLEWSVK